MARVSLLRSVIRALDTKEKKLKVSVDLATWRTMTASNAQSVWKELFSVLKRNKRLERLYTELPEYFKVLEMKESPFKVAGLKPFHLVWLLDHYTGKLTDMANRPNIIRQVISCTASSDTNASMTELLKLLSERLKRDPTCWRLMPDLLAIHGSNTCWKFIWTNSKIYHISDGLSKFVNYFKIYEECKHNTMLGETKWKLFENQECFKDYCKDAIESKGYKIEVKNDKSDINKQDLSNDPLNYPKDAVEDKGKEVDNVNKDNANKDNVNKDDVKDDVPDDVKVKDNIPGKVKDEKVLTPQEKISLANGFEVKLCTDKAVLKNWENASKLKKKTERELMNLVFTTYEGTLKHTFVSTLVDKAGQVINARVSLRKAWSEGKVEPKTSYITSYRVAKRILNLWVERYLEPENLNCRMKDAIGCVLPDIIAKYPKECRKVLEHKLKNTLMWKRFGRSTQTRRDALLFLDSFLIYACGRNSREVLYKDIYLSSEIQDFSKVDFDVLRTLFTGSGEYIRRMLDCYIYNTTTTSQINKNFEKCFFSYILKEKQTENVQKLGRTFREWAAVAVKRLFMLNSWQQKKIVFRLILFVEKGLRAFNSNYFRYMTKERLILAKSLDRWYCTMPMAMYSATDSIIQGWMILYGGWNNMFPELSLSKHDLEDLMKKVEENNGKYELFEENKVAERDNDVEAGLELYSEFIQQADHFSTCVPIKSKLNLSDMSDNTCFFLTRYNSEISEKFQQYPTAELGVLVTSYDRLVEDLQTNKNLKSMVNKWARDVEGDMLPFAEEIQDQEEIILTLLLPPQVKLGMVKKKFMGMPEWNIGTRQPVELNRFGSNKEIRSSFHTVMSSFAICSPKDLVSGSFKFKGSPGGGSGVQREFMTQMIKYALNPSQIESDEKFFVHTPDENALTLPKKGYVKSIQTMGRILGASALRQISMALPLCNPLLKLMMNETIVWQDLVNFDYPLYNSFKKICEEKGVVEHLDLTFEIGSGKEEDMTELKKSGKDIRVDEKNKYEYCDLYARTKFLQSTDTKILDGFIKGFQSIAIPKLFKSCGLDFVDMKEIMKRGVRINTKIMRKAVTVTNVDPQTVDWFWICVDELTQKQQSKLLTFWGGVTNPPPTFRQGRWRMDHHPNLLMRAAVCSWRIYITNGYLSIDEMRKFLLMTLEYGCMGYDRG